MGHVQMNIYVMSLILHLACFDSTLIELYFPNCKPALQNIEVKEKNKSIAPPHPVLNDPREIDFTSKQYLYLRFLFVFVAFL